MISFLFLCCCMSPCCDDVRYWDEVEGNFSVGVLGRGRRFLVNRYCLIRGLPFCTKHSRESCIAASNPAKRPGGHWQLKGKCVTSHRSLERTNIETFGCAVS